MGGGCWSKIEKEDSGQRQKREEMIGKECEIGKEAEISGMEGDGEGAVDLCPLSI